MRRSGIFSSARLLLVAVLIGCSESSAPAAPQTREAAVKAFDAAIAQMAWAQEDLWRLGGRDIVVSVQLDSTLAPHYFRLPRQGVR